MRSGRSQSLCSSNEWYLLQKRYLGLERVLLQRLQDTLEVLDIYCKQLTLL